MRVIDIENIVTNMKDDTRFVLRCEEVFHDKISAAAASILMNKGQKPIVCLTGPSGSGKTTTAMRLREYLENLGVKVCMLSMDNFFLPLDQRPPEASDWESPYCVNRDLLIEDIHRLMDGELVELPVYDFKAGGVGGYKPMQGDKDAVIIAEGIHMLNPLIFDQLRSEATGVYVAPRTRIITHKDRIVRPEQLRVARRMIRDYQGRGHSLRQTVERAESVDRGELNYIMPNKPNASIHIDTFHDYEPCILARYLKEIPEFYSQLDDQFIAEHGLSDLMDVVNSVPSLRTDYVPRDSIVREFVGGSCFEEERMHSDERRKAIADVLRAADAPISASALAEKFSVSRQIIVGDIALLRSSGEEILATPRGYVTPKEARGILRRVAVKHTPQEMEAELNTIVDNGCTVIDVIVDHPIYGQLTGPLQISNRYEVSQFIERCKKAEPLSSLTDGIHLHTLSCPDEAAFARTKSALRALRVLLEENEN